MIRRGFFSNWGIQQRAVFFALAPLLLISVFITILLTINHLDTAESSLNQRGAGIAKTLAKSAEFGLTVGDQELLQGLISAAMLDSDVISVEIYSSDGKLIAAQSKEVSELNIPGQQLLHFSEKVYPLLPAGQEVEEFSPPQDGAIKSPIGSVSVLISRQSLKKHLGDIIFASIILVIIVAIPSALLSWWSVRNFVNPVKRAINMVEDLGNNKLDTRVPEVSRGELGILEKGINDMAETIEQSQNRLTDKVEEKTKTLQQTVEILERQNSQLDSAHEATLEASRAKESFLAQISHELRTPLNAIIGFSRLLLRQDNSNAHPEYLKIINQAGDQLLTVINDVLNFSKLQSEKMEIHRVFFNPHEKLEEIIGLLSHEAHKKNLELVLFIHSDVPHAMHGDANRFAQILINLLNNAVKFTESGQVAIIAETSNAGFAVPRLKVSVVDTGIGITPEVESRLFSPFSQGDSSLTKHYSGTGLGLTISKALTESMGGEIRWENNLTTGTTFEVILPGISFFGAQCLNDRSAVRGKKALVIDTNALARRSIRNTLISFGVEVFQNNRLDQLKNIITSAVNEQAPFDLVVIGVNKDETAEVDYNELSRLSSEYEFGLIILIGDEETAQACLEDHQADQMQIGIKPYNRGSIYDLVCAALQLTDIEPIQVSELPALTAQTPLPSFSALVGDDNAFGQKLLCQYLEQLGASVETSDDGLAFVEAAETTRYELLFIDIHMPKLDGIKAAKQVKRGRGKSSQAPIIAVTADVFFQLNKQIPAEQNTFQSVIYKPIAEYELRNVVQEFLDVADSSDGKQERSRYPADLRQELEKQVLALESAAKTMDRACLKAHAHQLNGVTDFFNLPDFKETGRQLEMQVMSAEPEIIVLLIQKLRESSNAIDWHETGN